MQQVIYIVPLTGILGLFFALYLTWGIKKQQAANVRTAGAAKESGMK